MNRPSHSNKKHKRYKPSEWKGKVKSMWKITVTQGFETPNSSYEINGRTQLKLTGEKHVKSAIIWEKKGITWERCDARVNK